MLTFAVPYYNRPDLLQKCLASIVSQTSPHWQALICDDGPDGSGQAVVEQFREPRFQYHRNPHNLGMAGNWNQCLALARTPYVTLLHADDELLPNYASVMPALLNQHPQATAAFCQTQIIDEASRPCFSFPDWIKSFLRPGGLVHLEGESGLRAILRGNFIMCPTVCYRHSALPSPTFNPTWRFVLDFDFFARTLLAGGSLVGTPETAYAYRRHTGNATSEYTRTLLRFREESAIYEQVGQAAHAIKWDSAARTARRKTMIRLHMAYQSLTDLVSLRWSSLREKWHLYRSL